MASGRRRWAYKLEQLYEDQDPDYVRDAIPHLICWLRAGDSSDPHTFELREQTKAGPVDHQMVVSWDLSKLVERDPQLREDIRRFQNGKTLMSEDHPKYAAYGLALVAISCFLGARVVGMSYFRAPDLLLSTAPGALRGVEVAGRSSKGYAAFAQAIDGPSGKRARLLALTDVVEAYLSLWCPEPKVSVWQKVKP